MKYIIPILLCAFLFFGCKKDKKPDPVISKELKLEDTKWQRISELTGQPAFTIFFYANGSGEMWNGSAGGIDHLEFQWSTEKYKENYYFIDTKINTSTGVVNERGTAEVTNGDYTVNIKGNRCSKIN